MVAVCPGTVVCPRAEASTLSRTWSAYLNSLISVQRRSQSAPDYVRRNRTEAQRVAECICRPLARQFTEKRLSGVDKIILDQRPENTQDLRSATRLAGNGQHRTGNSPGRLFTMRARYPDKPVRRWNFVS